MKFTEEGKQRYLSRIEDALNCDYLNGWELEFLANIHSKILNSTPAFLSQNQWHRLEEVFQKADV